MRQNPNNRSCDSKLIAFFEALFPDIEGRLIEIRLIHPGGLIKPTFFKSHAAARTQVCRLVNRNQTANIYFGVCLRSKKSGTKESVSEVNSLWVDLDGKDFAGGKDEALQLLQSLPFPPSITVDSGNGYHAYWLLREPELIESDKDIIRIEQYLKGIANGLGGDKSAAELARILRVPGTFNYKDLSNPKPVEIVEFAPDRRYNLSDFEDFLETVEQLSEVRSSNTKGWISQAIQELRVGNRNPTFAKLIGRFIHSGFSVDETLTVLQASAEKCRFPLDEFESEVRGMYRRYSKEPHSNGGWILTRKCLADIEEREVDWLWHPYVPMGKLTLVAGDPGVGKSYLTLRIAAIVSRGYAFPEQDGTLASARMPGNVVILNAEDDEDDTIIPRLKRAGADLQRIHTISLVRRDSERNLLEKTITLEDLQRADSLIREVNPALLIVDPVQAFIDSKTNMNMANHVREFMTELRGTAKNHDCAVLPIGHLNKSEKNRSLYRVLGSIDFSAAPRSALLIGEDPNNPNLKIMTHLKHNVVRRGQSIVYEIDQWGDFYWRGTSDLTADDLTAAPKSAEEKSRFQEAVEFLQEFLSDKPRLQSEVQQEAKKLGIKWATVRRAKAHLGIRSKSSRVKGGTRGEGVWLWELRDGPEDHEHLDGSP